MSAQEYVGTAQRTFKAAVVHLLETDYGLLGSRRVLDLLARDLETLVEQFYPVPDHIATGWMVFTGTKASGNKAHPGKSAADYELVTLAWPVLLAEDLQWLVTLPKGREGTRARAALLQQRLVRIVEYGWQHPAGPVLLTLADLAAMLSLSPIRVSELLTEARRTTGKPLLTKGYYFDQGMRPTHKNEIIALYEAGLDEADIARQTGHAQVSTGQYIRGYERVKLLLAHQTPAERIPQLIAMQPNVAKAYVGLVYQYHPDLMPEEMSPQQT
jgi:integrase